MYMLYIIFFRNIDQVILIYQNAVYPSRKSKNARRNLPEEKLYVYMHVELNNVSIRQAEYRPNPNGANTIFKHNFHSWASTSLKMTTVNKFAKIIASSYSVNCSSCKQLAKFHQNWDPIRAIRYTISTEFLIGNATQFADVIAILINSVVLF